MQRWRRLWGFFVRSRLGVREDYEERAAIMQFCGGHSRLEAERLARERPWDTDPQWGMPKPSPPEQMGLDLGRQFFSSIEGMFR